MRYLVGTLAVLLLLSGPASARTKVQEEISGFDGTKTLFVAPHVTGMVRLESVQLSARWNSATPDTVAVGVTLPHANVPTSLSFNADGQIIEFSAPLSSATVQSSPFHGIEVGQTFMTTRHEFERIVAAEKLWVRATTPQRVFDCPVRDGKDHPAYRALKMLSDRILKTTAP